MKFLPLKNQGATRRTQRASEYFIAIVAYFRKALLSTIKLPIWASILVAIFATIVTWRYRPWMPSVFFGDDLANYVSFLDGNFASTPFQALTDVYSQKYRPVFALAIGGLFKLFGQQISLYLAANVLIHALSALLIFAIAFKLSRGNILVSFMSATLAATSRFALYQVTQVTGLLEGMGLLIFLAMIYCLIQFVQGDESAQARSLFHLHCSICFELLLVHTHERYIVVVPWIAILLLLTRNFNLLSTAHRKLAIFFAIIPVIITTLYKKIVLHSAFFIGTGGTPIQIDYNGAKHRLIEGILSLFGFNYGPEYLVGRSIASNPNTFGWQMALLFTVGWITILVLAGRCMWRGTQNCKVQLSLLFPFMLCILIVLLLLPPVMTIRMEQRWLLQPFLILLMIAAWSAGTINSRTKQLGALVFTTLAIAAFFADSYITKSFSNIFFVYSSNIASVIKRDVIESTPSSKESLIFVAGNDVCDWVLIHGEFFRIYGGHKRAIKCIESIYQPPTDFDSKGNKKFDFFVIRPDEGALDITDEMYASHNEMQYIDFLTMFNKGRINDSRHVDTPSGKGVSILPWDTPIGRIRSLTVISGFSYTYDKLLIDKNSALRFEVGMTYPAPEPARAAVQVIGNDGTLETVYSMNLPPQINKTGRINLSKVSIPLDRFSGQEISIMFNVDTPGSDQSGHWVAFARPRIVHVNEAYQDDRSMIY